MLHIEEKIKNKTYEISLNSNGIIIGSFVNIDGFFYYNPSKERLQGFWSEEFLKSLINSILMELENMAMEDINTTVVGSQLLKTL